MLLATLDDELDAPLSIDVDVHRRDPLRRAVDHQITRFKQIIDVPGDIETGVPHRLCMVTGGCEKAVTLLRRHAWPPVGADIRNPGQLHIVLHGNGVGDTLSDHAVAVDGDADLFRWGHRLLLALVAHVRDVPLAAVEILPSIPQMRLSYCPRTTRLGEFL